MAKFNEKHVCSVLEIIVALVVLAPSGHLKEATVTFALQLFLSVSKFPAAISILPKMAQYFKIILDQADAEVRTNASSQLCLSVCGAIMTLMDCGKVITRGHDSFGLSTLSSFSMGVTFCTLALTASTSSLVKNSDKAKAMASQCDELLVLSWSLCTEAPFVGSSLSATDYVQNVVTPVCQLTKSVIALASKKDAVFSVFHALGLPLICRMLYFMSQRSMDHPDARVPTIRRAIQMEAARSIGTIITISDSADKKTVLLTTALPVLIGMLDSLNADGVREAAVQTIMQIIGADSLGFKNTVVVLASMAPASKEKLEAAVREAVQSKSKPAASQWANFADNSAGGDKAAAPEKPVIELKMNFASFK